jgi:hypothetical protein
MKVCYFCEHFTLSTASPSYSDYTPGSDFEMWCDKSVWKFDSYDTSEREFAEILQTAEKCEFYKKVR